MTTRSVKELLADPAFREQLAKGLAEDIANRQRQRADFLRSETFTRMVAALRDNPNPVRVASEEIGRHPDRIRAETGWTFASEADLQLFFDVLASPTQTPWKSAPVPRTKTACSTTAASAITACTCG